MLARYWSGLHENRHKIVRYYLHPPWTFGSSKADGLFPTILPSIRTFSTIPFDALGAVGAAA